MLPFWIKAYSSLILFHWNAFTWSLVSIILQKKLHFWFSLLIIFDLHFLRASTATSVMRCAESQIEVDEKMMFGWWNFKNFKLNFMENVLKWKYLMLNLKSKNITPNFYVVKEITTAGEVRIKEPANGRVRIEDVGLVRLVQDSISSTFYKQLWRAQIRIVQKKIDNFTVFFCLPELALSKLLSHPF